MWNHYIIIKRMYVSPLGLVEGKVGGDVMLILHKVDFECLPMNHS